MPQPGLELRPLDPESSALIIRPLSNNNNNNNLFSPQTYLHTDKLFKYKEINIGGLSRSLVLLKRTIYQKSANLEETVARISLSSQKWN